jgi:hypothetical protein
MQMQMQTKGFACAHCVRRLLVEATAVHSRERACAQRWVCAVWAVHSRRFAARGTRRSASLRA